MSFFDDVKRMHTKFRINNEGFPSNLSREEHTFRIGCMIEELYEHIDSIFEVPKTFTPSHAREAMVKLLSETELRKDRGSEKQLEEQLDSLVDLAIFTLGTAERQGFDFNAAWKRVMSANMKKELAGDSSRSKRGFEIDLVKPTDWEAPNLSDLVAKPKGIIVLEGPDGSGKTSLAKFLQEKFDAEYIHLTWSESLEKRMDEYQFTAIAEAKYKSKEKLVIIDRHWVSELIYADVYRGGTNWPNLASECYQELEDLNALYVFCLPYKPETIKLYFEEFEKLKSERDEMYDSMKSCFNAYSTFVFGGITPGRYRFNVHKPCNLFMKNRNFLLNGAISNLNASVFDRFLDSDYTDILEIIKYKLKGE